MFVKAATQEVSTMGLTALSEAASNEKVKAGVLFDKITSYPAKALASFIAAPILIAIIAWTAENPMRRLIAVIGLMLSVTLSYLAATFLGSLAGAAFIASSIGLFAALGFLLGTTLSLYISLAFSAIVFNLISFVFLKINTQEVIDYLTELSTQ